MERELETLGDLLALDADVTARRLGATLVAEGSIEDAPTALRAVALVQKAAMRTLEAATDAIIEEAKEREEDDVFTRADIAEGNIKKAVRAAVNGNLRQRRGLYVAKMNDIAKRIAER
jgi:thioredoxin-like negative regulator of GroEL